MNLCSIEIQPYVLIPKLSVMIFTSFITAVCLRRRMVNREKTARSSLKQDQAFHNRTDQFLLQNQSIYKNQCAMLHASSSSSSILRLDFVLLVINYYVELD